MQLFVYVVCILQLSTLHVGSTCLLATACKEAILGRVSSFDGSTPTDTQYFLTNLEEITRSMCVVFCLMHSPECVSLLYDEGLQSCRLLRVLLSLKITNFHTLNTVTDRSQYWAKYQACEDGWSPFDGHCYYFNEIGGTWDDALDFCKQKGSYLMEIQTSLENNWIVDSFLLPVSGVDDHCPAFYSCSVWTGATDYNTTSIFIWTYSGTDMVFPMWSSNQPNNYGGNQHCIVIMRNGKANDVTCNLRYQFICEKE